MVALDLVPALKNFTVLLGRSGPQPTKEATSQCVSCAEVHWVTGGEDWNDGGGGRLAGLRLHGQTCVPKFDLKWDIML